MWKGGNINKCKNCGKDIPCYVWIDGKKRDIHKRNFCLDCVPFKDHNNEIVKEYIKQNNFNRSKFAQYTEDELQAIFDNSNSYLEVLNKLGLSTSQNNYKTLNKYIKLYNIDLTMINKNRLERQRIVSGIKYKNNNDLLQSLIKGEVNSKPNRLLNLLVDKGIKEYKCEECGISEYNGKPLRLELHHKDGNRKNNKLENLEMLCPNCHSQTDNYRFKNRKHK